MMSQKSTYVFNYCNLEGHTIDRCYIRIKDRKRELRKSQEAKGWSTEAEASRRPQSRYNDTVPRKSLQKHGMLLLFIIKKLFRSAAPQVINVPFMSCMTAPHIQLKNVLRSLPCGKKDLTFSPLNTRDLVIISRRGTPCALSITGQVNKRRNEK